MYKIRKICGVRKIESIHYPVKNFYQRQKISAKIFNVEDEEMQLYVEFTKFTSVISAR